VSVDELIVLLRLIEALRRREWEERDKRVREVGVAEKLLKATLLAALACYVVSLILGDWRGALGSTMLGLLAGIALVDVEHKRRLRELERRVERLERRAQALPDDRPVPRLHRCEW
jgi:hypothetical protein